IAPDNKKAKRTDCQPCRILWIAPATRIRRVQKSIRSDRSGCRFEGIRWRRCDDLTGRIAGRRRSGGSFCSGGNLRDRRKRGADGSDGEANQVLPRSAQTKKRCLGGRTRPGKITPSRDSRADRKNEATNGG